MLYVAVSFSVLCVLSSSVQQIVLIAAHCINRNETGRTEVSASRGKVGGELMKHDVRVTVGTADVQNGHFRYVSYCIL